MSIEEDIERLNSIVKVNKDFLYDIEDQTINQKEIKALEHLLQDYTRQKQINEEYKKENGLLRKKVKKLGKENSTLKNFTSSIFNDTIERDFLPRQNIIDKMEKLNKEIKNGDEIEAIFKIKQQQILQELLEEIENK